MALPTTLIRIVPPTLRTGYCYPASPQTFINDVFGAVQAYLTTETGNSFFNFGDTEPTPDNRVYPWLKTDGNWYVWVGGYWRRKHQYQISDGVRLVFVGAESDVWSFDGGDGNDPGAVIPTDYTGAMWEVDDSFEAKFPVGVGTFAAAGGIAVGGNTTTLGVTGEDQHKLTVSEMPAHTHETAKDEADSTTGGDMHLVNYADAGGAIVSTQSTGGDTAHNNLPPMIGVYFIKRTARVYYTA